MPEGTTVMPVSACVCGNHLWAQITKGYVILFSYEDRRLVEARRWTAAVRDRAVYAEGKVYGVRMYLHQAIGAEIFEEGAEIDHRNHNGLDCMRGNLRPCTRTENASNQRARGGRSRFKGVYRGHSRTNPWVAQIRHEKKTHGLGNYATEEEAARAYDAAAVQMKGQFAWLNFPSRGDDSRVFCCSCDRVHAATRDEATPWKWRCTVFPRPGGYGFVHPQFAPNPPYRPCSEINTDGRCPYFEPRRVAAEEAH
jgi:hypothetical protein